MTAMVALLGACALGIWPSTFAVVRMRELRPSSACGVGLGRSARLVGFAAGLLQRAWWAPGGVLLLVRPGVGAAVLLVAASVRSAWRARRARVRAREHAAAVQAALMAVVDELRVGAHPARAFAAAARECASATARGGRDAALTMREVAARARLGGDVGEGLRRRADAARRGGLEAGGALWERLASCWELSYREGVPMARVLGALRADVVEQIRFVERTDAALAGARSTAWILSGLPALCVLLGQALGAQPLRLLFSDSGSLLLLAGCGFVCAGVAWSRRITEGAGR